MDFRVKKYQKSKTTQVILLVVSLLLIICSSMFLHGITTHNGSVFEHASHSSSEASVIMDHDMTSVLTNNSISALLVFVVAMVILRSLYLRRGLFSKLEFSYFFSIRDRYGGFRTLNHVQNLFNNRILNPKIFSLVS